MTLMPYRYERESGREGERKRKRKYSLFGKCKQWIEKEQ
jgi:hypothetical protein